MLPDSPLITRFLTQHAQGTVPHAIILAGTDSNILAELAKTIASHLLGVNAKQQHLLSSEGGHPDLQVLAPEGALRILKIDAIRALIELTHQTPQQGHCQVMILQDADRLNTAAANALLKSLEEPLGQVYWILTSSHPSRLLPTITSRCALWSLEPEGYKNWIDELKQLAEGERYIEIAGQLLDPKRQPFDPLTLSQASRELDFRWMILLLQQMALDSLKRSLEPNAPVMLDVLFPKNLPSPWSVSNAYQLLETMQHQLSQLEHPVAQNNTLRWDGLWVMCFEILLSKPL